MALKIFFLLFLIVPYSIRAQQDTTLKQGKWIYLGKDRPSTSESSDTLVPRELRNGYHTNYRTDSTIRSEGNYLEDRQIGIWYYYFEDGKTIHQKIDCGDGTDSRICTRGSNHLNGSYSDYYRNGKLKESGTHIRNRYTGELKRYFESGCLAYEAFYNEAGLEQGPVSYYYDCDSTTVGNLGQLEFEYFSANGIATGPATRYWEDGLIREQIVYGADGEIISSTLPERATVLNKFEE